MNTATDRWLDADANARLLTAVRDMIGQVMVTYAPFGSTLAVESLRDLQEKLDACDEEKRAAEAQIEERIGPDAWLYDAWGR